MNPPVIGVAGADSQGGRKQAKIIAAGRRSNKMDVDPCPSVHGEIQAAGGGEQTVQLRSVGERLARNHVVVVARLCDEIGRRRQAGYCDGRSTVCRMNAAFAFLRVVRGSRRGHGIEIEFSGPLGPGVARRRVAPVVGA